MSSFYTYKDAVEKIKEAQAKHEQVKKEADEQESSSLSFLQRDGRTRSALMTCPHD